MARTKTTQASKKAAPRKKVGAKAASVYPPCNVADVTTKQEAQANSMQNLSAMQKFRDGMRGAMQKFWGK